jgi:hypothetical protein
MERRRQKKYRAGDGAVAALVVVWERRRGERPHGRVAGRLPEAGESSSDRQAGKARSRVTFSRGQILSHLRQSCRRYGRVEGGRCGRGNAHGRVGSWVLAPGIAAQLADATEAGGWDQDVVVADVEHARNEVGTEQS